MTATLKRLPSRPLDSSEDIERLVFTVNGKKITADYDDDYVVIDGTRQYLNWMNGKVEVELRDIQSSMTIKSFTTDYDEDYRITVDHDGGATTTNDYVYVNHGQSRTITFKERSGYTIEAIRVTVDGETYEAERGDSYLTVDGRRCSLSWGSSQSSITLNNIRDDMEVYCETDYDAPGVTIASMWIMTAALPPTTAMCTPTGAITRPSPSLRRAAIRSRRSA